MKRFILISLKSALISTIIIMVIAGYCIANEAPAAANKEELKAKAKKMTHDAPMLGELCVGCHMESDPPDPESISPKITKNHEVCNTCHQPDGATTGHCGCDEADDPMDCQMCHTTPATGTIPSAEHMNDLCYECHKK